MRISFVSVSSILESTGVAGMLVLGESDVEELLDPEGCTEAMADAFRTLARGDVHQTLRQIIRPPGEESLIGLMPVFRGGDRPLYGLKTVCVVPSNAQRGLDPHQGTVSLFDGRTGQTIAVMNAAPITAIRTAACSAAATRALARDGARTLAVVGTGHQARAHLRVLPAVIPFERVLVAGRDPAKVATLSREVGGEPASSVEAAVGEADVVVTATSSAEPVLRLDWLRPGAHINAVGACFPHTRELDGETMAASAVFVDRRESAESESGAYLLAVEEGAIAPGHIRAEIGEVLAGGAPGRSSQDELTVFESLGLAVEDLFAAEYLFERARTLGRGTSVEFNA
jgi:ornithine cyclodeaminase/alanine dehydrogenase-like protein (mu-crystallin family)